MKIHQWNFTISEELLQVLDYQIIVAMFTVLLYSVQ